MPFHAPNSLVYILATSSSWPASYLQSIAQLQAANLQRENESFCHKSLSLNRGYLFQNSSVCRALQKLIFFLFDLQFRQPPTQRSLRFRHAFLPRDKPLRTTASEATVSLSLSPHLSIFIDQMTIESSRVESRGGWERAFSLCHFFASVQ